MGRGRLHSARIGRQAVAPRGADERAIAHAAPEVLPRAFGLELERDYYLLSGEIQAELTHEPCGDLMSALRTLRRAVLMPEALDGSPHEEGDLEVTVPVIPELIPLLLIQWRETSRAFTEGPSLIVLPDLYESQDHCELRLAARALGRIDGRLVSAQAVADLGRTFDGSHLELVESARAHLMDRGQHNVTLTPEVARDQAEIPSAGSVAAPPEAGRVPQLRLRDELAGFLASCSHEHTQWRRNDTDDALLLTCDDCLRRRLACVPYHRLPADHPRQRQIEGESERYLVRENVYRRNLGLPQAISLEQIRALDGEASLNPTDHLRTPR